MKVSCIKLDGALYPKGEQAQEDINRLENGKEFVIDVKFNRNPAFHRLFFALIKTIFDSQDFFEDIDVFRKYIIMKSGRVQIIDTPKGMLYLPESIAYESMKQDDFEKLYQAIITFAVREYAQDRDVLERIMSYC